MYKDESIKMKELKKIFCDNSFITEPLSIKGIVEKINGQEKVEAMRSVVCRMQQGEDMDCVFNDVIKAIDTRDVELKRLTNTYLKKYTRGKTIRQLVCVNTLLKDLTDKSKEVKKATLEIIGFMGDEVVLKNYMHRLKKLTDAERDVQLGLIDALGRYPPCGEVSEMLKTFVYSEDEEVSHKALGSLSLLPKEANALKDEEIVELLKRKESLGAQAFLMKMVYKRRETVKIDLNFLKKTLKKNHLPLFYSTSSVLLHRDRESKQLVYDTSLLFMKSTNERLFHLLLFQEDLLDYVSYENSSYLVYENDPLFIKRQKIKMLFYRLDDTSIYEITRNSQGILKETILRFGLKKNFVIPEIFTEGERDGVRRMEGVKEGDNSAGSIHSSLSQTHSSSSLTHSTHSSSPTTHTHSSSSLTHSFFSSLTTPPFNLIDTLFFNFPFSSSYTFLVKGYLLRVDPLPWGLETVRRFLYLAGVLCEERPDSMYRIEEASPPQVAYDILKFYLSFFRRKILTEEGLLEAINSLKKKESLREKAKILLDVINCKGPYVLFDFAENRLLDKEEDRGVSLDLEREEDAEEDRDILSCKPYVESKNKGNNKPQSLSTTSIKDCLFYEEREKEEAISWRQQTVSPFSSISTPTDEWREGGGHTQHKHTDTTVHSHTDLIIDTPLLKGSLFLEKDSVKLEVDVLENPLKISFGVGKTKEILLEKEETLSLLPLDFSLLNKPFKLLVSNFLFELPLDPLRLTTPFECSRDDFEEAFKCVTSYKIVDKLKGASFYSHDDTSFSFKILGSVVYGKTFCDQVVLKGDKDVLDLF